ncbi:hypothetical protein, partial [Aeromonas caviae]|uniref:hypothetical protein n=1 Tax=Aeromonas caviae TaxID=648 RepID=UPI0038CFC203
RLKSVKAILTIKLTAYHRPISICFVGKKLFLIFNKMFTISPWFKLQTPESIKASLRQQIDILTPLHQSTTNILRHLGNKAFERLVELQDDYNKKQKIANDIMQATLQGLPLDTIAGIAWQTMWTAAKNFIKSEPKAHNFPPIQGDFCPFCLQDISEVSAERLAALSTYLADSAATDAKDAHNLLKNALLMISSQDVSLNSCSE